MLLALVDASAQARRCLVLELHLGLTCISTVGIITLACLTHLKTFTCEGELISEGASQVRSGVIVSVACVWKYPHDPILLFCAGIESPLLQLPNDIIVRICTRVKKSAVSVFLWSWICGDSSKACNTRSHALLLRTITGREWRRAPRAGHGV